VYSANLIIFILVAQIIQKRLLDGLQKKDVRMIIGKQICLRILKTHEGLIFSKLKPVKTISFLKMPKTFIVAEAGINACGDVTDAYRMMDYANRAGVDAIKFQLWERGRFPDLEQYRFKFSEMAKIKQYANIFGLKWFCTPFDFDSIDFLSELGMDIWKVPSGMMTNERYIDRINSVGPDWIILSTGMADIEEIVKARHWVKCHRFTVLHCVSRYPATYDEMNLNAMTKIQLGWNYGLSDHTLGIEIPIAAIALGASVIEKHFTLDRNMPGPDQKMSLEPDELKAMVKAIRNVEMAMGDGIKKPTPSEMKHRDEIRERMKL
jgi:N,N'-diacetyllegionaminate synthase